MMLKIGIKGFTLVEVMVTAMVLSLGAMLLYQAFFLSLSTFDYCSDYLRVSPWMDEKVWEVQDELARRGAQAGIDTNGELLSISRGFIWDVSYGCIDEKNGLYKIDLSLSWQRGQKKISLLRTAYATCKKQ
jgi:prepilin-type N-terminal cleavage/methylation domain-containing protein